MKPEDLTKLSQKLIRDFKIETLILYGSRAERTARADSDWNFFGVVRAGKTERKRMSLLGNWVDLKLVNIKDLEKMGVDLIALRKGVVLSKDSKLGDALIAEAKSIYSKGAPKADTKALAAARKTAFDLWSRKEPLIAASSDRMLMLVQSPEILCRVNRIWYEGTSRFERMLKKKSPKAFALMEAAFRQGPFSANAESWIKYCWTVSEGDTRSSTPEKTAAAASRRR